MHGMFGRHLPFEDLQRQRHAGPADRTGVRHRRTRQPLDRGELADKARVVGTDDRHQRRARFDHGVDDHVVDARGPDAAERDARGEDVEHLFGFGSVARPVLPPYVEFAKVAGPGLTGRALRDAAIARFADHWANRPERNPVDAYRAALPAHLDWLASEPPCSFHPYAFNTARQFGACMSLLAAHLDWLARQGVGGLGQSIALCEAMSSGMKTFQFLLARARARKKTDGLDTALDAIARDYDLAMDEIGRAFGFTAARTPTLVRTAS